MTLHISVNAHVHNEEEVEISADVTSITYSSGGSAKYITVSVGGVAMFMSVEQAEELRTKLLDATFQYQKEEALNA